VSFIVGYRMLRVEPERAISKSIKWTLSLSQSVEMNESLLMGLGFFARKNLFHRSCFFLEYHRPIIHTSTHH